MTSSLALALALLVSSLSVAAGRPGTHDGTTPLLSSILDGPTGAMHPIPTTPTGKSLFTLVGVSGSATTKLNRIGTVLQMTSNQPSHIDVAFSIPEFETVKDVLAVLRFTCGAHVVEKKFTVDVIKRFCPSHDTKGMHFCHESSEVHHLSGLRLPSSSELPASITQACVSFDTEIILTSASEPLPLIHAKFEATAPAEAAVPGAGEVFMDEPSFKDIQPEPVPAEVFAVPKQSSFKTRTMMDLFEALRKPSFKEHALEPSYEEVFMDLDF